MRALRRFTVRLALPPALAPLAELVMNLRWSWHPQSLDLFRDVDPATWDAVGHDPVRLLGEVSPDRLAALAKDPAFLGRLEAAHADLQDYLTTPRWYQGLEDAPRSIAYFSPEFGITEVLPQYSGGLGILAGDHLKAASDLGVPIVGVGLLYRAGYFKQSLNAEGWQQERYPPLDPHGLPLTLVTDAGGSPVLVGVEMASGRTLHAHVWRAQVGRVPLLLLDSDVEENAPEERAVTDRLYGGGTDHRLHQELLLGIGGVRALRAWTALTGDAEPEVFHTNEGHAGFLGVERVRELVQSGLSFDEAREAVRAGTVFTTHTPVPAGIDRFPRDLIAQYFSGPLAPAGVDVERILELGAEADPTVFNMAHMGLRMAQRRNGVAKLHGIVSRGMFADLWPGFDSSEVPISSVTNGVHAPTWVAREVFELAEREIGASIVTEAQGWERIAEVADTSIWATRRVLRERLVEEVRRRLKESWLQRGATEAELGWTSSVFDPDVLTIGFARRVPSYKRLTLMMRDPERLKALLLDPERPVQLVIAGKAHPADDGGKELVQHIVRFADQHDVRHRIVFLPDYDIGMARYLYGGCDVWLNNPLRPLEACGTSGMKSALNGGLNLSILDGWWDEMYDGENGWAIPTADGVTDPERRDDLEAAAFYELVEKQVRTRFYDRDANGVPQRWIDMVRHTLQTTGPKVLASRMVRDYVHELYAPAAGSSRALAASSYAPAKELAHWRSTVAERWGSVRVVHVEAVGVGDTPEVGTVLDVRATVDLGGLAPGDVTVQAAYGRVDEADELRAPSYLVLTDAGTGEDGTHRYEGSVPLERPGSFGYSVRVLPHADALPERRRPGPHDDGLTPARTAGGPVRRAGSPVRPRPARALRSVRTPGDRRGPHAPGGPPCCRSSSTPAASSSATWRDAPSAGGRGSSCRWCSSCRSSWRSCPTRSSWSSVCSPPCAPCPACSWACCSTAGRTGPPPPDRLPPELPRDLLEPLAVGRPLRLVVLRQVRRPVAEPGLAVELLAQDVDVTGVAVGLGEQVDQHDLQRDVPAGAPPRDPAGCVEVERGDRRVAVRPHAAVQPDDVLSGLLGRGPHVGVRLGAVRGPGQGFGERPREDLTEVAGIDGGEVLDDAEHVAARRCQGAPRVVLATARRASTAPRCARTAGSAGGPPCARSWGAASHRRPQSCQPSTCCFSPSSMLCQLALNCSACSALSLPSWVSRRRVPSPSGSREYTSVW